MIKAYKEHLIKIYVLLIIGSSILFPLKSIGQVSFIKTGMYDSGRLFLAKHDSLKLVTGIIDSREHGISCKLFLSGIDKGNKEIEITLFNPVSEEFFTGKLVCNKNEVTIKANGIIFPCQRFMDLENSGESFAFTKKVINRKLQMAMIKVDKAMLYEKPGIITKKRSYLISGDVVAVRKIEKEWVLASYLFNSNLTKWIKISDLTVNN